MKYGLFLITCVLTLFPLRAQDQASLPEGETNWPGIHFQIVYLKRLSQDHLLVGVRLFATDKAPPSGTLIGIPVPIPANANPRDIAAGNYRPSPFTMDSSVMTDELTKETYSTVPSIAPVGHKYRPAVLLGNLVPGQSEMVTLQFKIPPPPPPPKPGQPPVKQTLSFFFTNAKESINHVPLPAPLSGA